MLDLNQSTGSTPSLSDISIFVIVKMSVRLSLRVIRARLATKIAPKASSLGHADLFLVECGDLSLRLTTRGSAPKRSRSPRSKK